MNKKRKIFAVLLSLILLISSFVPVSALMDASGDFNGGTYTATLMRLVDTNQVWAALSYETESPSDSYVSVSIDGVYQDDAGYHALVAAGSAGSCSVKKSISGIMTDCYAGYYISGTLVRALGI